ncbi:hypothetical protein AAMO2058_000950300 [Amorphochlora amoebiformis]
MALLDTNKTWRAWQDKHKTKSESASIKMLCGAGAGLVTKTAIAPMERIKILFQVQGMMKESPYGRTIICAVRAVYSMEGLLGFWKGNAANCLRVMPNYALKFTFNDTFRDMVKRPDQKKLSFGQLMLAGSLAGMFQLTMTYPLEVLRARTSMSEAFGNHYGGLVDCAVKTVRQEGVGALYNGYAISLLSGTPYVGFQMSFNTLLKRLMPRNGKGKIAIHHKLLCGALAGLSAQTIIFPGDTMRRRMQVDGINGQPKQYKNFVHCFQTIVRTEGVMGLYRGLMTNVVRCIPGASIQFVAYDSFQNLLGANPQER